MKKQDRLRKHFQIKKENKKATIRQSECKSGPIKREAKFLYKE